MQSPVAPSPVAVARPLGGWWVPAVSFASGLACSWAPIGLHDALQSFTHRSPSCGAWYFIEGDLVRGAFLALSLALTVPLALAAWRRFPQMAYMAFVFQIWTVPAVVLAAVLALRTGHPFDPARSTSPWSTPEGYLAAKSAVLSAAVVLSFAALMLLGWRLRRQLRATPA